MSNSENSNSPILSGESSQDEVDQAELEEIDLELGQFTREFAEAEHELEGLLRDLTIEVPTEIADELEIPVPEPLLVEEGRRQQRTTRTSQRATNPVTATATMTSTTALGNSGMAINIVATKNQVQDRSSRILYKKENRSTMDADKLASLMKEGTSTAHKKFDVLNLGLDDAEKLDETYDLQVIIQSMRERHDVFDFTDVFTIVIPNEQDEKIIDRTYDLYSDYAKVTPEDVARSNLWYREWASDDWYKDNLGYTYEYLKNNTNEDLWVKVAEAHNAYHRSEQGGPLFFILMVEHLLSSSEAAAEALVTKLRKFKITNVQGEDVFHAVSLLRGAIARLKHIDALPQDLLKNVLTVMQTSSVPKFNQQFQRLEEERERDAAWKQTQKNGLTPEKVFALAESLYRSMMETDTWTGITTKGTESVFNVQPGKLTCFNCGGPHTVDNCTKPKDQKRIEANRKAYLEARKKQRDSNGGNGNSKGNNKKRPHKFRLPERGENLKRIIDDKPMYFSQRLRRWIPDREANTNETPAPAAQVNAAQASTAPSTPSTITAPSTVTPSLNTATPAPVNQPAQGRNQLQDPQRRQLFEASLATVTQSFNNMLTSYTQELLDYEG